MSTVGYNSGETLVYFENTGDAERVRADLVERGVPASAVTIESSGGSESAGFLDTVKEFFGMEKPADGGALLRLDGAYAEANLPFLRECGGVMSESDETTVGMASTRPQAAADSEQQLETEPIDVPVQHEAAYIEPRPVTGTALEGMIEGDDASESSRT